MQTIKDKEIIAARMILYNSLMKTNESFRLEIKEHAERWKEDNKDTLYGLEHGMKVTMWSVHVHSGVLDDVIAKYI